MRNNPDILEVSFRAKTRKKTTYNKRGFEFPKEVTEILGVGSKSIAMTITTLHGNVLFCGIAKLTGRSEMTAKAACKNLEFDQEIRVTASRPPNS